MDMEFVIIYIRLFVRLLIGIILLSAGINKLRNRQRFQKGIREYQILPARQGLLGILGVAIPCVEIVASIGLISGFLLELAATLASVLFVVFSGALIVNLLRGRRDLSCHCGGVVGDHRISWWIVGRNALFIVSQIFLLTTTTDAFIIVPLNPSSALLNGAAVSTILLPVVMLVGMVFALLVLVRSIRTFWRS